MTKNNIAYLSEEIDFNLVMDSVSQEGATNPPQSNPLFPSSTASDNRYAMFLDTEEKHLFYEIVDIIDNFSAKTQWDYIIFANETNALDLNTNDTGSYNLATYDLGALGEADLNKAKDVVFSQVGKKVLTYMANNGLNVASQNDLMSPEVQRAYLHTLFYICNEAIVQKEIKQTAGGTTQYSIDSWTQLVEFIFFNTTIKTHDGYKSLNTYLLDVKRAVVSYAGISERDKKIFLFFMKPALVGLYIMRFIRVTTVNSQGGMLTSIAAENEKPNGFLIEVISMFVFRLYVVQTAMLLLKVTANTEAVSSLNQIIDAEKALITSMFDSSSENTYYSQLNEMMKQNKISGEQLQDTVLKLQMARNNLEKAVNNDIMVNGAVKRSYAWMYTWMSLFIVTVVVLVALVLLADNEKRPAFFMYTFAACGGMSLVVLIAFFIKMIRST